MPLLLICNPVCGDSTAEQFLSTHVIPRLHAANCIPTEVVRTRASGHAGREVLSFLDRYKGDITIVLGSGDGTLHEIVNQLVSATDMKVREDARSSPIRFVLVPCGTANALYASLFRPPPPTETVAYKSRSLDAFFRGSAPRPLILSLTSLLGPLGGQGDPQSVASVVVTSTALHAAILKDSEKLRKEIPNIERFKVAAKQNITKWYASRVKLLPVPSSGAVYTYDPGKGDFVPPGDSYASYATWDVHGPFAYFLSTVNVDRLESDFRINPTISKCPAMDTSMDVVMVRPWRDPTFSLDTLQARERFAEKISAVLTTAYRDGDHINLRYSENGDIIDSGDGNTVVECFRCGGWEWIPDETDEGAHWLCADGTIFEIEKGGRAITYTDTVQRNLYVHV